MTIRSSFCCHYKLQNDNMIPNEFTIKAVIPNKLIKNEYFTSDVN